jgi:hypothetical protein
MVKAEGRAEWSTSLSIKSERYELYLYKCIHVCTYIYEYICLYIYLYIYLYLHLYINLYTYLFTYIHTGWQRKVEQAITNGQVIIIENLSEDIDATMDPVLSRYIFTYMYIFVYIYIFLCMYILLCMYIFIDIYTYFYIYIHHMITLFFILKNTYIFYRAIYKKGRNLYIKFGGEEVEYDSKFQLYLQTKLSNPHYKPEIAAQCTLVNFIATEKGLEDQLLAKTVGKERPELEEKAQALQASFQQYKIQLVQLEDDLLERLANAPEDILSDVPLIEGLEATKLAAKEIFEAVIEGRKTEVRVCIYKYIFSFIYIRIHMCI